ncbi:MAG: hypothetical protein U0271_27865 [Polyangiaceae bacterium]
MAERDRPPKLGAKASASPAKAGRSGEHTPEEKISAQPKRSSLPLFGSIAFATYVISAIVNATGAPDAALAGAIPAALVLTAVHLATRALPAREDVVVSSARLVALGCVLGITGLAGLDFTEGRAAAALGCAAASLGALRALSHIAAEPGLASDAAAPQTNRAALVLLALGWLAPLGVSALRLTSGKPLARGPLLVEMFGAPAAALASMGTLTAAALLASSARAHELGVPDRLRSFATISATAFALAVLAGAAKLAPLGLMFTACALATCAAGAVLSAARKPERVSSAATQFAVLGALCVAPAIGLAAIAKAWPERAALAVVVACVVAAAGGLLSPLLAKRLAPRREPWTEALAAARAAATLPDPEPALEQALLELRALSPFSADGPSLYKYEPAVVTTTDRAGYARTEPTSLPPKLAELASGEAGRVLLTDVLRAISVRRPDVRGVLAWLEDRRVHAAAVVFDGDAPLGMLALPRGERQAPLTLAEVTALGDLMRVLGAQIAAGSRLARSIAREAAATTRATESAASAGELTTKLTLERDRSKALAEALAARARVALYSPAARLAVDSLEGAAERAEPLVVVGCPGVDPLPYLAIYHLARGRDASALVVVDGRSPALTDLELWRDPERSPIERARGGTLAILDPQLLPKLVQGLLGAHDARDHALAIVVPETVDVLAARGLIEERLADRLGDRAIALPPLAARGEDLRPLILDHLVRLGLRHRGKPMGIDAGALAVLTEHLWPGNDAELETLLTRAVRAVEGDLLTRRDLARLGFVQETGAAPAKAG